MSVTDMIFDLGEMLIKTFSGIADWFCTPISLAAEWPFDDVLGIGGPTVMEWICEKLYGFEVTPLNLILGPGLTFILGFALIKWFVDMVL